MDSLNSLEWAYEDAEELFLARYLYEVKLSDYEKSSDSCVKARVRSRNSKLKLFKQASLTDKIKMVPQIVYPGAFRYTPRPEVTCEVAIRFVNAATLYNIAKTRGLTAALMWKLAK